MGLFKALFGPKSRIATSVTPFHNGYVYLTVDEGGLYADVKLEDGTEKRIRVEGSADMLKAVYDPTGKAQDVYAYADAIQPDSMTLTLPASGWNATTKTQVVQVPGVDADETTQLIQPVVSKASKDAYRKAGVECTDQGANSLTFTAKTIPTEDLTVYVVITDLT